MWEVLSSPITNITSVAVVMQQIKHQAVHISVLEGLRYIISVKSLHRDCPSSLPEPVNTVEL